MSSALVLLSSGLDSTVNFVLAKKEFSKVRALTFNYGQQAAIKELASAKAICDQYNIELDIIDLAWLGKISNSSLNKGGIPTSSQVDINSVEKSQNTAKSVWVPNRNGVFLNIAASFAEAHGIDFIVPGFNKEEAQTFPDNSQAFLEAMDSSLSFSTQYPVVKTKCFTTNMDKAEIVKLGRQVEAPFELMWPCYFSGEQICKQCESCQRFLSAQGVS